jgi:hypothetical protein
MKTYLLIAAAVVIQPAVSVAQTSPAGAGFQQAQALGSSDGVVAAVGGRGGRGGRGGLTIGKPYSATAVTHTVQVLADGSQIERTQSQMLYRDEQGRTRTETNEGKLIQIVDRVAGLTYNLDTAAKTARTLEFMTAGRGVNVTSTRSVTTANGSVATTMQEAVSDAYKASVEQFDATHGQTPNDQARRTPNMSADDLGTQFINGVQAKGVRTTSTIPVGAIGNNRELKIVGERWESTELGIMVKSVNTDPRFGTTTYELTNISQSSPDPSLFRVPAGYTTLQPPKLN